MMEQIVRFRIYHNSMLSMGMSCIGCSLNFKNRKIIRCPIIKHCRRGKLVYVPGGADIIWPRPLLGAHARLKLVTMQELAKKCKYNEGR